jgi:hypothetical protein
VEILALTGARTPWHDGCTDIDGLSWHHPMGPEEFIGEATMKKHILLAGIVSTFLLSVPLMRSLGEQKPADKPAKPTKVEPKTSEIMKLKLKHAQKVLEGIALNDFETIGENARSLLALSQKAEWRVFQTPSYLMHSNEFQPTTEKLIQGSKDKNLDAATLAYLEMTLNCVRCHKYVREVRMTRGEPREDRWLAQLEPEQP